MSNGCIIIGATRTGITLADKLSVYGISVRLVDTIKCPSRSVVDKYTKVDVAEDALLLVGDMYFVTSDDDSFNVKMCLSINQRWPNAHIFTMFSQDSLGKKMATCIPNFDYINPAKQAADQFVKVALENTQHRIDTKFKWSKLRFKPDSLLKKVAVLILSIMTGSTLFFHFHDGLPWIDAFYFTITMMSTVGFGDYSLKDKSDISKIFGSMIMMLSVTSVALIFALVSDTIIRRRKELTMGRFSYKGSDHVIVIGCGSVGFNVVTKLVNIGEIPVVLDMTLDGKYTQRIIDMGVPHLVGDAKDESNIYRAGLGRCKAVICVTQDDLTNLEVGMDVKSAVPNTSVVLRIYDQDLAANLRRTADIKNSLSMSTIAADEFITIATEKSKIKKHI